MMHKLIAVGVGLVVTGMFGPSAWAEEKTAILGKTVAAASRLEEQVNKVPAHITVITADDIENSTAGNVAEVLSTLVGAHVMDTNGNKRNYNVDLRGAGESSSQNLLLLVDGRRINLPDLSGPDWNLVPLERIARIEVIRGGRGTVLYGDNAGQGVINIITKQGGALKGHLGTQYGSYNTLKGSAGVSNVRDRFAYDLFVNYLDTDGFRDNSNMVAKDINADLRFDPSHTLHLSLSAGYHYDDTRHPGTILDSQYAAGAKDTDTFSPDDFSQADDGYVKAGMEMDMLSNDTFKLEASLRNNGKIKYNIGAGGWLKVDTQTDVFTLSPQFIFREDFDGVANRITLGLDYAQSEQDGNSVTGTSSSVLAAEKENWAYYLHDDLSVGKQLSLSGGYRWDRATFKYNPAAPNHKRTFEKEGYAFGLNYALSPHSHLYGNYTHSFRYPVLDELFDTVGGTVNMALLPQASDAFEIGASAALTSNVRLTLNAFRSETENEIFFNPTTGVDGAHENVDGRVVRQGAELGLAWHHKLFSLAGTYTHIDVDIQAGQFKANQYPFVPEDKFTATAGFELGRGFTLGVEAIYVGERVLIGDWDNTFYKDGAYTVVNAKVKYQWRRITFFADLNNVFDEKYSTYSVADTEPGHYPAPDFNVLVGVTARFGAE